MKREVEYFETTGTVNTKKCIDIVENLISEGFKNLVVASTSGNVGIKMAERVKDKEVNLVVVTHSTGFKNPNYQELTEENKEKIEELGGRIYTGTILTHSLETSLAAKFGGVYPTLLISHTLRRLGEGIKVCCEIVMEACDAGLILENEEVIAVGGTGQGADTVTIIKSASSKRFLELKVLEILAKPRG